MRRFLFLGACLALAATACGGDDSSPASGTGGSGGTTATGGSGGTTATGGSGGTGGTAGSAATGGAAGTGGQTGSRFPLTHQSGERFLREASGKPFFFHGDTSWSLIAQVTKQDAEQYLEDRRQKGFTVILVNLLEHEFSDKAPANIYGDAPFATAGDFSSPNEAYFAHADWVLQKANEKGLLVLLAPAYLGYGGGSEGFYQEMVASSTSRPFSSAFCSTQSAWAK